MTLVNASSVFSKFDYREMVEDHAPSMVDTTTMSLFKDILKRSDYQDVADYSSIININKQRKFMNQYKNSTNNIGTNWFGRSI